MTSNYRARARRYANATDTPGQAHRERRPLVGSFWFLG